MITETQILEIRTYLIGKKLPLDIALEVQDHFVSQIETFQKNELVGFEQAFLKTKLLWQSELSFRKKSIFSFQKVTQFLYKIHKQQFKNLTKKAVIFTLFFCLIQFSTAFIFSEENYYTANIPVLFLAIILSICIFFFIVFSKINKRRTMVEQYFYTELVSIFIVICSLSMINIYVDLPTNSFKVIYSFLNQNGDVYLEEFLAVVSSMFVNITVLSYVLLLLKTRNKAIQKLKKLQIV